MCETWLFAVLGLMKSSAAISALSLPPATKRSTSSSRTERAISPPLSKLACSWAVSSSGAAAAGSIGVTSRGGAERVDKRSERRSLEQVGAGSGSDGLGDPAFLSGQDHRASSRRESAQTADRLDA